MTIQQDMIADYNAQLTAIDSQILASNQAKDEVIQEITTRQEDIERWTNINIVAIDNTIADLNAQKDKINTYIDYINNLSE